MTNDRQRSGRPRLTSAVQDHFIRLCHLCPRFTTASAIPKIRRLSDQTVRNYEMLGLERKDLFVALFRLAEADFNVLTQSHSKHYCICLTEETFCGKLQPRVKRFGGGSVMMWATISEPLWFICKGL